MPQFEIFKTAEAAQILAEMAADPHSTKKIKKVYKTLALLEAHGPGYPSLPSHEYSSLQGPSGQKVWESYVENQPPGAWPVFWYYGPDRGQITVVTILAHP